MDILTILESAIGFVVAAIIIMVLISLLGVWKKYSDSKKAKDPMEQKKAMDELLKNKAITKKEYDQFFYNRQFHEAYDKGELSLEDLEKETGQKFDYLKK